MKRLGSSDDQFFSAEDEFAGQMMGVGDEDGGDDMICDTMVTAGGSGGGDKKRRLNVEQVRALERSFEVENKLEPERKLRLAQELGLQPRQVAVWFQNRRARWKTKQLERDYSVLKDSFDSLRRDFDALAADKEALLAEIKELKAKLGEEEDTTTDPAEMSFSSVKEEPSASESENKVPDWEHPAPADALIFKDGSSDSDSSAILNLPEMKTAGTHGEIRVDRDNRDGEIVGFHGRDQLLRAGEDEDAFLNREDEPCGGDFFSPDGQAASLDWYYAENWG